MKYNESLKWKTRSRSKSISDCCACLSILIIRSGFPHYTFQMFQILVIASIVLGVFGLIDRPQSTDRPFYYPTVIHETYGHGKKTHHLTPSNVDDLDSNVKLGMQFMLEKLSLAEPDLIVSRSFQDHRGIVHVYASHVKRGLEVCQRAHQVSIILKD